jgi:hypothetical protein
LSREELVAAPLTTPVFTVARDDYADLRVLDGAGQPVPFVLDILSARSQGTTRRDCPAEGPQAREPAQGALELLFTLRTDVPSPTGLTIDTPLRDFRQRVRVEGSADGAAWQVLADGAVLYDLSRFVDVRQCEVSWPPNTCRSFRVTLFDATRDRPDDAREVTSGTAGTNVRQTVRAEPFRVRSVRFWRAEAIETGRTPVRVQYGLERDAAASRRVPGETVFRSGREPLTRITFATTNRLFNRHFTLCGSNPDGGPADAQPARCVASGRLTQIRFQEISRTEMTVEFPASRFRQYSLGGEVATGDATELTVAKAEGVQPRVVFLAAPGRAYVLEYGNPSAEYAPLPEAAALRTLLTADRRLVDATLGPPDGAPAARSWRAWLNSSAAMFIAMGAAGLILALVLVAAARKVP